MSEMCPSGAAFGEYMRNFEFIKAIYCEYVAPAGEPAVVMLIIGAVVGSIYIRTGSVIIPAGLVLLAGGVILPIIAPPAVAMAAILVMFVGAGIIAYAYARWS